MTEDASTELREIDF